MSQSQSQQQRSSASYDEFYDRYGNVRPHQKQLQQFLEGQGHENVEALCRALRSRLAEQEVTFNILGVPEGTNRPWQLDPLPLVLDYNEYAALGNGLKQRARLLELVLADLYGPQRLLKSGILPVQLVFENPRFWRECHGWMPAELHLYAADLSRDQDGRYLVYSDRTAAPAGAGYTLENRLVLGGTLSELFRRYSVLKLNRFFHAMRRTIERLGSRSMGQPRVVVLTPGMQDESSFEHAYLSRYLGYELVEGRDLTVRDQVVYLKTLYGLKRVDVILRRVFDDYCDPLELRADSVTGVPGLVAAARAGRVSLANPLGSALVESPALKAYLPQICRELLGEELKLASVPTFWCGEPKGLAYVLDHLDELTIKPAFADRRGEPIEPRLLSVADRSSLIERLKSRPWQFVGEHWNPAWTAPFWSKDKTLPGKVSLRTFLCRNGDDYEVMNGGLARIDGAPDGLFLSLNNDRIIKDVWVPSPTPVSDLPLPAMPEQRLELRRGGVELPSRLLDDVFWLGRYIERADSIARLLRAGFERTSYDTPAEASAVVGCILSALRALEVSDVEPGKVGPSSKPGLSEAPKRSDEEVLGALLSAQGLNNNLRATLERVHYLTLGARTRLSRDAWHALRRLKTSLDEFDAWRHNPRPSSAIESLDALLIRLAAVTGTVLDGMVRGQAWMFLDTGRRVERGILMLTLLKNLLPEAATRVHMEALLEIADSLLTYRARYLSSLQAAPVVDLLLTDETNPRAVRFQVDQVVQHLESLPRDSAALRGPAERRMIKMRADLLTLDLPVLCGNDGQGLRELLGSMITSMYSFSDELTQRYFSHVEAHHALAPAPWINDDSESK